MSLTDVSRHPSDMLDEIASLARPLTDHDSLDRSGERETWPWSA